MALKASTEELKLVTQVLRKKANSFMGRKKLCVENI